MYDRYLHITTIPVGEILKRILAKEGISQRQLAIQTDELPQRINDIIAGRRKITPKQSLKIEKVLNIKISGFFYKIQANHDIYLVERKETLMYHPDISLFRKNVFWDIDLSKLDWTENKGWIIQRIFEYGNEKEMNTIIGFYGKAVVQAELDKIKTPWNCTKRINNRAKYL